MSVYKPVVDESSVVIRQPDPPQLAPGGQYPPSPLCDVEVPIARWEPGKRGGAVKDNSKFIDYIKSKTPGLPPGGWRDITPYFGKVWPKSLSSWRTSAAKSGFYISVKLITKDGQTYRAILVCINPAAPVTGAGSDNR
jgi:hypothetical protein